MKIIEKLKAIACVSLIISILISSTCFADNLEPMKVTCYCPESCAGEITASGTKVRYGICATEEHMGDCAMIYYTNDDKQLEFLGYFECLDRIGTRSPYVVDIWTENLDKAKEIMTITKGQIYVMWIEGVNG